MEELAAGLASLKSYRRAEVEEGLRCFSSLNRIFYSGEASLKHSTGYTETFEKCWL